jgi:hypothetical protein
MSAVSRCRQENSRIGSRCVVQAVPDGNAVAEASFKTQKSGLLWRTIFHACQKADQAIGRYIGGFYDPVRRHSAPDFRSPAQFEKMALIEPILLH